MKNDVLRQTLVVALGELIGVATMLGIFALLGKFDNTVLLGGIVGAVVATGNFFTMAVGVHMAAEKAQNQDVKGGQAAIRVSYIARMAVMALIFFAFAKSGLVNVIALVVPLVFMRPTLTLQEFFKRKQGDKAV